MGLSRIDADRAACAAAPLVGSGPTPATGPLRPACRSHGP